MDARDVLRTMIIVIDALDTLQRVARLDGEPQAALQTIDVMIDSLRDSLAGRTTPDVLAAELHALVDVLETERRGTKAAVLSIDDKFDPGGDLP